MLGFSHVYLNWKVQNYHHAQQTLTGNNVLLFWHDALFCGAKSHFFILIFEEKKLKMLRAVFYEDSETDLGIGIRHRHQKLWRNPTLQSMSNPAVYNIWSKTLVFLPYFNYISFWPTLAVQIRPKFVIAETSKMMHFRCRLKYISLVLPKLAWGTATRTMPKRPTPHGSLSPYPFEGESGRALTSSSSVSMRCRDGSGYGGGVGLCM